MTNVKKATWKSLAEELGTTVMSLHTWRKMDGAPDSPDVEAWTAFVAERGLNRGNSKTLAELKVLIAQEELKKKRRENEVAEGRMIEEQAVSDFLREWVAKLDMALTAELDVNAPPMLAGKSIVEVREEMRAIHDRIRDATKRGLLKWEQRNQ